MIIAIAGIKRSASTVMYNLVRIALKQAGFKVNPCKHNYKPRKVPEGEVDLVKRHPFKRSIATAADHIFLTDRPDAEILASLERFTGEKPGPDKLKKMRINLHLWKKHSDIPVFPYHYWTENPLGYTRSIVFRLKLDVDPQAVLDEFNQIEIPDEYDPVTCFFPGHITKK